MKALAIIALILGLGAAVAGVLVKVETNTNHMYDTMVSGELDLAKLQSYGDTLDLLHRVAWMGGGLAVVLGMIAYAKQRVAGREQGTLAIVAIITGLVGAGLSAL